MMILIIGGCGYIGSYLYSSLRRDGFEVDICDTCVRGNPGGYRIQFMCDYQLLSPNILSSYTHVLWFAGHSSVADASHDPIGALRNNCLNLFELTQKLAPSTRLIYASTASLYSSDQATPPAGHEDDTICPGNNPYDISKFAFDYIASGFVRNFIGLRMGTLCGHSPNLRRELIFNQMNLMALTQHKVLVCNSKSYRSLLFLSDLYQVIRRCITQPEASAGFFNVASLNLSIGDIAQRIAAYHQVEVIPLPDHPTYSFTLDTNKVEQILGVDFDDNLYKQCATFCRALAAPNVECHDA